MFAVIYRNWLKPDKEEAFQSAWHIVATYFVEHQGALGSTLHQTPEGMWVAYSRWPSKAMRDAAWPGDNQPSQALPVTIRDHIKIIQNCLDPQRKLPDIEMQVIDDQLFPNKEFC